MKEELYVTRYALTNGYIERKAGEVSELGYAHCGSFQTLRLGTDCFRTEQEAIARVEEMRKKKLASLQKQVEKLQKLKIKVK